VTSKDVAPYITWNIPKLSRGLQPLDHVQTFDFIQEDFPGYTSRNVTKKKTFPLTAGKTFVFAVVGPENQRVNRKPGDRRLPRFKCEICEKKMTSEVDAERHKSTRTHQHRELIEQLWENELVNVTGWKEQSM